MAAAANSVGGDLYQRMRDRPVADREARCTPRATALAAGAVRFTENPASRCGRWPTSELRTSSVVELLSLSRPLGRTACPRQRDTHDTGDEQPAHDTAADHEEPKQRRAEHRDLPQVLEGETER